MNDLKLLLHMGSRGGAVAQKLVEMGCNIRAVCKEEKTAAMHATINDTAGFLKFKSINELIHQKIDLSRKGAQSSLSSSSFSC